MSTYFIGPREFKTKGAAKDCVKLILNKDRLGQRLDLNEEVMILDLFYSRDKNRTKVKRFDVSYVYIRNNGKGSNEFVICPNAGDHISFSYLKCFLDLTPRAQFTSACRLAILPYKPYCPKNMERHHSGVPMAKIIDMFVTKYDLDINSVEYAKEEFKDIELRIKFYEFHDIHAEYQIVSHEEHAKIHGAITLIDYPQEDAE